MFEGLSHGTGMLLAAKGASDAFTMLAVTISAALPLLLAALGGLYAERSGIINIGLEGMMLIGAFAAGATSLLMASYPTIGPWMGIAMAGLAGMLLAGLHAFLCIRMRADQIISGVAINILVAQGTIFASMFLFGGKGGSSALPTIQEWSLGRFQITPLVWLGVLVLGVTSWLLWRTPFGLRLRACGEQPKAAHSAGIHVARTQMIAVLISGMLAGWGGAILLQEAGRFGKEMTAGRGYIAIAALIFGGWRPLPVCFACLFFGGAFALKDQLAGLSSWQIPSEWLSMLPYVLAMLALCGLVGRVQAPAALGSMEDPTH